MTKIHSSVTDLPLSCKSAANHMAQELNKEEAYAELTDKCCRKIADLEYAISREMGERVALVAYRLFDE